MLHPMSVTGHRIAPPPPRSPASLRRRKERTRRSDRLGSTSAKQRRAGPSPCRSPKSTSSHGAVLRTLHQTTQALWQKIQLRSRSREPRSVCEATVEFASSLDELLRTEVSGIFGT